MDETRRDAELVGSSGAADPALKSIGRYRLLGWLASGGMGEVHVGHDPKLDRPVAIKRIRADLSGSSETRDRLIQEARLGAQLSHPNIVQVYDFVTRDDVDYIVSEYVEGLSLREVARDRPMGLGRTLEILGAVVRGLNAAHEADIVHRDLKSENVLVGNDGAIKIADFGIARAIQRNRPNTPLASTDARSGTYRSMSPEQTLGGDADARTDFFSLGTLAYELLTGVSPFAADSADAMMQKIREAPHTPLIEAAPGLPFELSRLVDQLLEKDSGLRPANATEVANALDRISRAHVATRVDPGSGEGVSRHVAAMFVQAHPVDAAVNQTVGGLARWRRAVLETATRHRASVVSAFDREVLLCVGFPRSHANNAEAAAHLAREIAARSGAGDSPLDVSAAIDVGQVTVLDPDSSPYFVGSALKVAAELGRSLDAGAIVASAGAQPRLADAFDLTARTTPRPAGGTALVYTVAEPRDPLIEGSPLPHTPLIGRDVELSRLRAGLTDAKRCLCLVVAAAGMGKTRLMRELLAQPEAGQRRRLVIRAREKTRHTALAPFAALASTQLPELRGEDGRRSRESIAAAVEALGADPAAAWALSILCGVETSEGASVAKRGLPALVADGIAAIAKNTATVLIFEDVHWSDRASLEVLQSLVDSSRGLPLSVVATTRPGSHPLQDFDELELRPLTDLDAARVIEETSRGRDLAPDIGRLVVARAQGLPLALEEITRTVLEREGEPEGIAQWVPASFSESVNERLDDLPAQTGRVALLAAAVGGEVEPPLLAAAARLQPTELGAHVRALIRHGLMTGVGSDADARLTFRHSIMRDVIVERVLPTQRASAHAAILAGIEQAFPGWAQDRPEIVAHHRERSGDARGAVESWKVAGIRLAKQWTFASAQAHLEHAVALAMQSGQPEWALEAELDVRRALSRVLMGTSGWGAAEVEANNSRMAELVDATAAPPGFEDQYGAAAAAYVKADADRLFGQLEGLSQIVSMAPPEARPLLEYLVGQMLGIYHLNTGPPSRAREELTKAVELRAIAAPILRQTASSTQGIIAPRAYLALLEVIGGRFDHAAAVQEEEEADHSEDAVAYAFACAFGCTLMVAGEQYEAARWRVQPVLREVEREAGLPRAERRIVPQIEHTVRMIEGCLKMHDLIDSQASRAQVEEAARAMREGYRGWQGGFMRVSTVQYLAMAATPCLRVAEATGTHPHARAAALKHAGVFLSEARAMVEEENPLDRYYASEVIRLDADRGRLLGDKDLSTRYDEASSRAEAYAAGEPEGAKVLFDRIELSRARS